MKATLRDWLFHLVSVTSWLPIFERMIRPSGEFKMQCQDVERPTEKRGVMSKHSFRCWKWRLGVGGLVLVCLFVMRPSLMAQTSSTGALTGTVKDPSGAVIPNATVTATSLDTGAGTTARPEPTDATDSPCFRPETIG